MKTLRAVPSGPRVVEVDRDHHLAPRMRVTFRCPHPSANCIVTVPMSTEATDIPLTWDCPRHGAAAERVDPAPKPADFVRTANQKSPARSPRPPRNGTSRHGNPEWATKTPWEHLLERRSIPELEALLEHRLAALRRDRGRPSPRNGLQR